MQVRIKNVLTGASFYFDDIPYTEIDNFILRIQNEYIFFNDDKRGSTPAEYVDSSYTVNEYGLHLEVLVTEEDDEI